MRFPEAFVVCETSNQSFTEVSQKKKSILHEAEFIMTVAEWQPPHFSRPRSSGSLGTVGLEAKRSGGTVGHSNMKCEGIKH